MSTSLRCPLCGSGTNVLDSRPTSDGIRRRRACDKCQHRFTTYEQQEPVSINVRKRDGRSEPYDRDKLLRSVRAACHKRELDPGDIDRLVMRVEDFLHRSGLVQVASSTLGERVCTELMKLDKVSYIRYYSMQQNVSRADDIGSIARNIREKIQ